MGLAGPPGTVGQGLCTTHIVYTGNSVLHSLMKQSSFEFSKNRMNKKARNRLCRIFASLRSV